LPSDKTAVGIDRFVRYTVFGLLATTLQTGRMETGRRWMYVK